MSAPPGRKARWRDSAELHPDGRGAIRAQPQPELPQKPEPRGKINPSASPALRLSERPRGTEATRFHGGAGATGGGRAAALRPRSAPRGRPSPCCQPLGRGALPPPPAEPPRGAGDASEARYPPPNPRPSVAGGARRLGRKRRRHDVMRAAMLRFLGMGGCEGAIAAARSPPPAASPPPPCAVQLCRAPAAAPRSRARPFRRAARGGRGGREGKKAGGAAGPRWGPGSRSAGPGERGREEEEEEKAREPRSAEGGNAAGREGPRPPATPAPRGSAVNRRYTAAPRALPPEPAAVLRTMARRRARRRLHELRDHERRRLLPPPWRGARSAGGVSLRRAAIYGALYPSAGAGPFSLLPGAVWVRVTAASSPAPFAARPLPPPSGGPLPPPAALRSRGSAVPPSPLSSPWGKTRAGPTHVTALSGPETEMSSGGAAGAQVPCGNHSAFVSAGTRSTATFGPRSSAADVSLQPLLSRTTRGTAWACSEVRRSLHVPSLCPGFWGFVHQPMITRVNTEAFTSCLLR